MIHLFKPINPLNHDSMELSALSPWIKAETWQRRPQLAERRESFLVVLVIRRWSALELMLIMNTALHQPRDGVNQS